MSSSVARAQTSGRSLISRWPQSAMTRIGASQAARVLEAVLDRHLLVARAPEDEHRAANPVELLPRVVADQRPSGADRVGVEGRPAQQPVDGALGQQIGVRDLEAAEDEPPPPQRAGDPLGAAAGDPARLDDPGERDHHLGPAGRARDPGGRSEHDAADELGPALASLSATTPPSECPKTSTGPASVAASASA